MHLILSAMGKGPPRFVDAGAGATEAPVSVTLQVPYPATVVAGNFLLCQVYAVDTGVAATVDLPAGWTGIRSIVSADGFARMRSFYKTADGTETGNLDVTTSGGDFSAGRIYRFSHGSAVEADSGTNTDSSGTGMTAVDLTTLGPNRRAVQLLGANVNTTIGDIAGESGADYTEAVAEYANAAGVIISCQTALVPAAAAITGGSATLGSAGIYRIRHGFAIVP